MPDECDDLCPRPLPLREMPTRPLIEPIYLASVYQCSSSEQADRLLAGQAPGYVYSRDGHPNADSLAEKCRQLHGAERAAIASSGMAALALALLSQLKAGDHVVVSSLLYGRSLTLLTAEAGRFGVESTLVDTCDLAATREAFTPRTRMLIVETITNPLLRVSDLSALADLAHTQCASLLVDNTLAGPVVCRPLEWGADFVLESLTKSMNGHSDVVLGLLCGPAAAWPRVPGVLSSWGLTSAPMDCWLALRGLGTLAIRAERASANAKEVARFLESQAGIEQVYFPGSTAHPDHETARRQFGERFGSMVTFTLAGGRAAADRFIAAAKQIPFCPSLGELSTTLSHPESTSHRGLSPAARAALGIAGGTIRLSVGIESADFIRAALAEGLSGC